MRLILPAVLLSATTAALANPRADLELLPQARIGTAQVVLGDVVRVRSEDLALVRRLVNLPVGEAPQAGDSALVRRESLSGWVQRTTGLPEQSLHWSGAEAARITRTSRQLKGEDITAAALEGVRHRMGPSGMQTDLRVRASIRDVDVPEGRLQLLPRVNDTGPALRNRTMVWVDAWVNDRFIRSVPVTVEILQVSGERRRGVVASGGSSSLEESASAVGQAAVTRGEWAALRTTSGAVSLESRVEVLQDGRVGQRIRVRATSSATGVVFAKVVGPGQLELTP